MFKDFLNKRVCVVITTRSEGAYEVKGLLSEEDDDAIIVTDARIGVPLNESFKQNGFFNGPIQTYKEHTDKLVINKKFIIFMINE